MQRRGFSLTEVLVAVSVTAALAIPVLELATQNSRALRADRARCVAELLASSTLERFGTGRDDLRRWLAPVADDPWTLRAHDLWERLPALYAELGMEDAPTWSKRYEMHLTVELHLDVEPGLDVLVCEVTWLRDGGIARPPEKVSHVRALLRPHTH